MRIREVVLKLLLVAAAVVSMLSLGGLLVATFIPLVVAIWWTARGTGLVERTLWVALASLMAAEWVWIVSYPALAGWTVMSLCAVAGTITASFFAVSLERDPGRPAA